VSVHRVLLERASAFSWTRQCCWPVDDVRRDGDDELCGHVERRDGRWLALTVFGTALGAHDRREDAVDQVLGEGLASLSERWTLRHTESGEEEIVRIQEANAAEVTVVRGYYALPGVPTLTISARELAAGKWELLR
jgi:hypothetical protein